VRKEGLGPEASGTVRGTLPAGVVEQGIALYLAGDSPRIIGRALGVPAARVYLALKERGAVRSRSEARTVAHARERRARGEDGAAIELPAGWEAVVVERYAAGESARAVADELGFSQDRVYELLHERGVSWTSGETRKVRKGRRGGLNSGRTRVVRKSTALLPGVHAPGSPLPPPGPVY
jgi:hypothetical protein